MTSLHITNFENTKVFKAFVIKTMIKNRLLKIKLYKEKFGLSLENLKWPWHIKTT